MKEYVLGFAFDKFKGVNLVGLIRKDRPEWQAGLLNGMGGKVEEIDFNEYEAMKREFLEETGVLVETAKWNKFAIMAGEDYLVHCFWSEIGPDLYSIKTMESEIVNFYNVQWVLRGFEKTMKNIPLLIQACLNDDVRSGKLQLLYLQEV